MRCTDVYDEGLRGITRDYESEYLVMVDDRRDICIYLNLYSKANAWRGLH